jgi:ribosomal-protein-alanine N-acetyltransferase
MLTYRDAIPEDAARITALHATLFDEPWPEETIAAMLSGTVALSLVVERDLRIVGFLLGRVVAGEAEILSLGVGRAHQGQSLGRGLIGHWLALTRERGATDAVLEVATDNQAALALYRSAGFIETGRRRGYYHRPGGARADALTMARVLGKA